MDYIIIMSVCFFASMVGAICGIGGGVIIKPVLDATGVMPVTTISFLSGCTVLSMSVVSVAKNYSKKRKFDISFAIIIATGAVVGGILGKHIYQRIICGLTDTGRVGAIQAAVLIVITVGTLVYTCCKNRISTKNVTNSLLIFIVGLMLGMMSSFLGIGGGPINLVLLFYLFSMETKQAAVYSIFIIMCSQISSLISTLVTGTVPEVEMTYLVMMVLCGVAGGVVGSKINAKIESKTVDKLFIGLMLLIIVVSLFNIIRYR